MKGSGRLPWQETEEERVVRTLAGIRRYRAKRWPDLYQCFYLQHETGKAPVFVWHDGKTSGAPSYVNLERDWYEI